MTHLQVELPLPRLTGTDHQPQHREGARPRRAAVAVCPRRRGDWI